MTKDKIKLEDVLDATISKKQPVQTNFIGDDKNTTWHTYNPKTHILIAKADVPEEKTIRKINKYVLSGYPQQMDKAPPTLVEKGRVRMLLELIADKREVSDEIKCSR